MVKEDQKRSMDQHLLVSAIRPMPVFTVLQKLLVVEEIKHQPERLGCLVYFRYCCTNWLTFSSAGPAMVTTANSPVPKS